MTKLWGIYVLGNELETVKESIASKGLKINEIKTLSTFDVLITFGILVDEKDLTGVNGFYNVVFEATEEEYNDIVESNNMTKVF